MGLVHSQTRRSAAGQPRHSKGGTKLVPIGPQRLRLFGRLYRALRNTKYGRLLSELMTRTLGCLILAGLQHPGPLRGPPTAGPTLAMTNLPTLSTSSRGMSSKHLLAPSLRVLLHALESPVPVFLSVSLD